ncbi:MAG: hypothetical protein KJO42_06605 [Silicimonas sp.]|nr:hypothetical protein [Silicimonas sp.]MBT8426360.1 hypothetical protein [Silicimonas sp.]NND21411.1 hypothetical protein [Silicimonas sp.]NND41669.1 hypothetical protein [Silicimonas sp.]NNL74497.1 hypothetical protein [Silicimonas sp.]
MSERDERMPSDIKFGRFFTAVFLAASVYFFWTGDGLLLPLGLLFLAIVFLALTLLRPEMLYPLNRGWFLLGIGLGMIVSPIVLGIIFFVLIAPIALIMRLVGRDELKLSRDASSDSHWIERVPAGPTAESFRDQF